MLSDVHVSGARRRWASVAVAAAIIPLVCGSEDADSATAGSTAIGAGTLHVVTSFYPLQFVVEHVGADRVSVANLTPPGIEPHDLELTADDLGTLQDADLVVYLAGFSPAVDDAVETVATDHALEVGPVAGLDLTYSPIEGGEPHEDERGTDPHFWLDPTRLAAVADEVAARLAAAEPDSAASFTAGAAALREELEALDDELAAGLADCESTDIVTSHNAFAYLAQRYGMTQVGITGLTPEGEPTPAELADVTAFVADHDVSTIYTETLVSPAIAETVAAETGAATAVLDPIEGLSDPSGGGDYVEVMRANLATLRAGQRCP